MIITFIASLALTACSAQGDEFDEEHLLHGRVSDTDGNPIAGVMVRLKDTDLLMAESVFTDTDGFYQLPTDLVGQLSVRTRVPYYSDQRISVSVDETSEVELNIELQEMQSDAEISNSLPSVFHFNQISFDLDPQSVLSRSGFQRDCAGCHQFGNELTRSDRDGRLWSATIRRMHGYLGDTDEALIARKSEMLDLSGPYGDLVKARPDFPVIPEMAAAKIYEFPLKDVLFPHDAEISPVDGKSYSVDRMGDAMIVTDLDTGLSTRIDMPPPLRPAVEDANGYTSRSSKPGPHSLAMGGNGLWYTTNATSDEIGVFDPQKQAWVNSYVVPEPARYPHTVRIDANNTVWFTLAGSEQVGRLDPATGDIKLIDLPRRTPIGIAGATTPYGIDVSPVDGKVWYARLYGDAIGFVDPETLEATEYDSPVRGPRRLRFNAKGELWLTGYTDGMIAQIETDSMSIEIHEMPEFEKDHRPAPYSLAIHPTTQDVWINETMTDRVYRYIRNEKRFLSYPMPLRGTYTRDFSFTKSGMACTANSPIMNFALEDGMANLICIDPDAFTH
ncbi:MAG: carboxypeptidase regulatory-like domain-containing protein [Pseudomonadota bacterium]